MWWRTIAVVLAALVLGPFASSGSASMSRSAVSVFFRGPGGNVVCGYFAGGSSPAFVECGVRTELRPAPPRPLVRDCHGLDFAGNRARLRATGRVVGFCSGDVGVLAEIGSAPRLRYGRQWHMGPFVCRASVAWLTCTNRDHHGFSLGRLRWRSF